MPSNKIPFIKFDSKNNSWIVSGRGRSSRYFDYESAVTVAIQYCAHTFSKKPYQLYKVYQNDVVQLDVNSKQLPMYFVNDTFFLDIKETSLVYDLNVKKVDINNIKYPIRILYEENNQDKIMVAISLKELDTLFSIKINIADVDQTNNTVDPYHPITRFVNQNNLPKKFSLSVANDYINSIAPIEVSNYCFKDVCYLYLTSRFDSDDFYIFMGHTDDIVLEKVFLDTDGQKFGKTNYISCIHKFLFVVEAPLAHFRTLKNKISQYNQALIHRVPNADKLILYHYDVAILKIFHQ